MSKDDNLVVTVSINRADAERWVLDEWSDDWLDYDVVVKALVRAQLNRDEETV